MKRGSGTVEGGSAIKSPAYVVVKLAPVPANKAANCAGVSSAMDEEKWPVKMLMIELASVAVPPISSRALTPTLVGPEPSIPAPV